MEKEGKRALGNRNEERERLGTQSNIHPRKQEYVAVMRLHSDIVRRATFIQESSGEIRRKYKNNIPMPQEILP